MRQKPKIHEALPVWRHHAARSLLENFWIRYHCSDVILKGNYFLLFFFFDRIRNLTAKLFASAPDRHYLTKLIFSFMRLYSFLSFVVKLSSDYEIGVADCDNRLEENQHFETRNKIFPQQSLYPEMKT